MLLLLMAADQGLLRERPRGVSILDRYWGCLMLWKWGLAKTLNVPHKILCSAFFITGDVPTITGFSCLCLGFRPFS